MKSYSEKRLIAEPGRGREIMSDKNVESCNLLGRDFPVDEHLLSNKDISIVISKLFYIFLLLLLLLLDRFRNSIKMENSFKLDSPLQYQRQRILFNNSLHSDIAI